MNNRLTVILASTIVTSVLALTGCGTEGMAKDSMSMEKGADTTSSMAMQREGLAAPMMDHKTEMAAPMMDQKTEMATPMMDHKTEMATPMMDDTINKGM